MNKPEQLIFPWTKKSIATFDDFYMDDLNLYAKDALLNNDDLFLYGIVGTGKSFCFNPYVIIIQIAKHLCIFHLMRLRNMNRVFWTH